jgi:hypothetical protein
VERDRCDQQSGRDRGQAEADQVQRAVAVMHVAEALAERDRQQEAGQDLDAGLRDPSSWSSSIQFRSAFSAGVSSRSASTRSG